MFPFSVFEVHNLGLSIIVQQVDMKVYLKKY